MLIPPVTVSSLKSFWYPFDNTDYYFWCQKEGYDMGEFTERAARIGCAIEDACERLCTKELSLKKGIDEEFKEYSSYVDSFSSFIKDNDIKKEDLSWQDNVKSVDENGDCIYYGRSDVVYKKEVLDIKTFSAWKKQPISTRSRYGTRVEEALFQSFLYAKALGEEYKYGVLVLGPDGYTVFRPEAKDQEKFEEMLSISKSIIARFKKSYFLI